MRHLKQTPQARRFVGKDWSMRAIFYEGLSGLPSKIITYALGLGGIAATAWPDSFRKWVSMNMTPEQIRIYGIIGITMSVVYLALIIWLKPKTDGSDSISRKMEQQNNPRGLARFVKIPPKPDIPITALYARVYKKLGGTPSQDDRKNDFYKKVDREIADAVVLNKLSTWGYYRDTAIRSINYQSWQNGIFNHRNKTLSIPGDSVRPMIFNDLKFNKEETDEIWPPK